MASTLPTSFSIQRPHQGPDHLSAVTRARKAFPTSMKMNRKSCPERHEVSLPFVGRSPIYHCASDVVRSLAGGVPNDIMRENEHQPPDQGKLDGCGRRRCARGVAGCGRNALPSRCVFHCILSSLFRAGAVMLRVTYGSDIVCGTRA